MYQFSLCAETSVPQRQGRVPQVVFHTGDCKKGFSSLTSRGVSSDAWVSFQGKLPYLTVSFKVKPRQA